MSAKIEPALGAEEWNRGEDTLVVVGTGESGERIEADARDTDLYIDVYGGDGFYNRCDVARPAALIALANAALPDDDLRKITREKITRLRSLLQVSDDYAGDDFDESDAFLDALESYLPPEAR